MTLWQPIGARPRYCCVGRVLAKWNAFDGTVVFLCSKLIDILRKCEFVKG